MVQNHQQKNLQNYKLDYQDKEYFLWGCKEVLKGLSQNEKDKQDKDYKMLVIFQIKRIYVLKLISDFLI